MPSQIRSVLFAILGLSLIIIVHESGHFLMCKLFDVKTPVFSVGFGPVLAHYKANNTTFQLAALPLGGYVAIDPASLATKTYLQKIIINIAGITFNIIFALLLLIYLMWLTGTPNSVINGILTTYQLLTRMARAMFGMWQPEQRSQIMGPIGIVSSTTETQNSNPNIFMLWWLALINLNVALFNLLPIPLLDGGHIMLDTIEGIYGKPLPSEIIGTINIIFLLLFLGLLFVISMRDVQRLRKKTYKQ
jgi:regulator of sigma E protease